MAVYRFILTFLIFSMLASASSAFAAPEINQPSAGSTLSGSAQTFSWSLNDADDVGNDETEQWWLYVGTSIGARDIANSDDLGQITEYTENAKDRIGAGPWQNANGVVVATTVESLLSADNNLTKETLISETGEIISGLGDEPNRHDILTGTDAQGNASENTCNDRTSSGDGSATVGHHDRSGGGDDPTSWSSAHSSRGCSLEALQGTGGDGLFYCFAQ